MTQTESALTFNILIKKTQEYGYVAHCLELDLVATAQTLAAAKSDILDVIIAQLRYAFANDNLEHLYHPAAPQVWKEFYECGAPQVTRYAVSGQNEKLEKFVPPWIIANTCHAPDQRHV